MQKIDSALKKIEACISGAGFISMICVIAVNVLARFIFQKSFAWAEEIAYMTFNWAVYFGICLVYRNQGLIAIDALVDRLSPKAQHAVQVLTFALVGVVNLALMVWGARLSVQGISRKTPMLQIPYLWIYICIPLACAILAYYSFGNMVKVLRGGAVESAALEDRS